MLTSGSRSDLQVRNDVVLSLVAPAVGLPYKWPVANMALVRLSLTVLGLPQVPNALFLVIAHLLCLLLTFNELLYGLSVQLGVVDIVLNFFPVDLRLERIEFFVGGNGSFDSHDFFLLLSKPHLVSLGYAQSVIHRLLRRLGY